MKTYKEVLDEGCKYLKDNDIIEFKIDGWYLLSHILKIDRAQFLLDYDKEINETQYRKYKELIKKRANHVPLQYITGYTEFMGLKIKVNEHVLIPRQETEILVEEVMKISGNNKILDLCTGSGCIITSLMKLANVSMGVGADISKEALVVARGNAKNNDVEVTFIESDLFDKVTGKFDIIVSNPPYIPKNDIKGLSPEVRDYEPYLALDGKEDGLYFYKRIIKDARKYLEPKGYLFFEIGYNQADDLMKMLKAEDIHEIQVIKDLAGHDRVIKARYM